MSRVLGRAAVGLVVGAAATLPLGSATAQAAPITSGPGWSVDTDPPAGLTALPGGGFSVTVPAHICSVDFTVIGGQGGADVGGVGGGVAGELRITSRHIAGQTVVLQPGSAGQDASAGGAGGAGGTDGGPFPGGQGGVDSGGGGGSSFVDADGFELRVHGGDGAGVSGGRGAARSVYTTTGNTIAKTQQPGVADTVFDGDTGDPAGSRRTGAGLVTAVGTPCPVTPPGSPLLLLAGTFDEDGAIRVAFQPTAVPWREYWAPVTGWEVTLDGGGTWQPMAVGPLPESFFPPSHPVDGALIGFVRGLADGEYAVAVRATSDLGPGAATPVRVLRVASAPTGIAVTDVTVAAGVSSLRVFWTPSPGAASGWFTAESYDAAQSGEGNPFSLCEAPVEQPSCVLVAEPGRSYRVVVSGGGGRAAAPVTSGVVAAPPVPAQVPASSGALQGPASLTAGQTVDVSGAGFLARSTVTVVVYSTPTVLGSLVAEDGAFDTSVTLPAGLPAGEHTLVATGVGPDGEPWTLTRSVTAQGAGAVTGTDKAVPAAPATGGLAYTGAYVGVMAVGGAVTVAAGVALLLVGRRRRRAGER